MLPITNHKVVHVPHTIAFIAALIGLVAALSWDHQSASQKTHHSVQPVLVTDKTHGEERNEHAAKETVSDAGATQPNAPKAANQWSSSPAMPLFIPSNQGRR